MNEQEMTTEERLRRELAGSASPEAKSARKLGGLKNLAGSAAQAYGEHRQVKAEKEAHAAAGVAFNQRYDIEVNKGSMNAGAQTRKLNARWVQGWRLHTAYEQHGNTVFIFERIS